MGVKVIVRTGESIPKAMNRLARLIGRNRKGKTWRQPKGYYEKPSERRRLKELWRQRVIRQSAP